MIVDLWSNLITPATTFILFLASIKVVRNKPTDLMMRIQVEFSNTACMLKGQLAIKILRFISGSTGWAVKILAKIEDNNDSGD